LGSKSFGEINPVTTLVVTVAVLAVVTVPGSLQKDLALQVQLFFILLVCVHTKKLILSWAEVSKWLHLCGFSTNYALSMDQTTQFGFQPFNYFT
jgi:hypothetical protein